MKNLVIQGKRADDATTRVCVLYSPEDGRVIHVHGASVAAGATPVSEAEMESRARRHAVRLGRNVEGVGALHVPYSSLAAFPHGFKVNPEGTGLVALNSSLGR
jgi:hypothetical protein